jgi:hypothetical protein
MNLILHKEVTLFINLFNDDSQTHIKSIQYKLEGDEYTQWGDDDSYIEKIVSAEIDKLRTPVLEEIPLEEFEILAEESVVAGEPVKPVRKTRAKKTA